MTRRIWWGDFGTRDFEAIDPNATLAVLPVAAIEQHGPHLPLSTDSTIMDGMLKTVFANLPDDLDARFLPVQMIGKSDEHSRQPGTLTLDAKTAIEVWSELGDSIARTGIRKLIIVTSHGGNEEVMGIVARTLRVRHDMMVVKTSWGRFGLPDGLFSKREVATGIHGGDYETSLMLHFAPHLVDMGQAQDFPSAVSAARAQFEHLAHQSPHGFAWLASDLNPAGVVGEAHRATAEKGAQVAAHQSAGFVSLLADLRAARLADWITGSAGS